IVPEGVIADAFPNEEKVYEIIRMSLINDHPYALQKAYIPYSIFSDATRFDFENGSLYDYMQDKGYRPKTMISYLRIENLPEEYVEIMQTDPKKKFLLFDYYGFDKEHRLVEYTVSYHHADYTKFRFEAEINLSSL
ncbi:MAG: UTRA domain-containing protein, partial [bacterium]